MLLSRLANRHLQHNVISIIIEICKWCSPNVKEEADKCFMMTGIDLLMLFISLCVYARMFNLLLSFYYILGTVQSTFKEF